MVTLRYFLIYHLDRINRLANEIEWSYQGDNYVTPYKGDDPMVGIDTAIARVENIKSRRRGAQ